MPPKSQAQPKSTASNRVSQTKTTSISTRSTTSTIKGGKSAFFKLQTLSGEVIITTKKEPPQKLIKQPVISSTDLVKDSRKTNDKEDAKAAVSRSNRGVGASRSATNITSSDSYRGEKRKAVDKILRENPKPDDDDSDSSSDDDDSSCKRPRNK